MKALRVVSVAVSLTVVVGALAAPALADPPLGEKNVSPLTFDSTRGSASRHFVAVGITQSAQIAGQIVGTNEVVMFVQIVDDGAVVFNIKGLASSDQLWTCTIDELPGVVAKVTIRPPT